MQKGTFITLEGTDGSGKTTQIALLKEHFKLNDNVIFTREPGGTDLSEKIREIIINNEMHSFTEAFLYAASRCELVSDVIAPAILSGKTIICDRFVDSSIAYQGEACGLGIENIELINSFAHQGILPDITFFLNLQPQKAIERKTSQSTLDRIESKNLDFHKKVYNGYTKIAERDLKNSKKRIYSIDATLEPLIIHKKILKIIEMGVLL